MRWNRHRNGIRWFNRCQQYVQQSMIRKADTAWIVAGAFNQFSRPNWRDSVIKATVTVIPENTKPNITAFMPAMERLRAACRTRFLGFSKNGEAVSHIQKTTRTRTAAIGCHCLRRMCSTSVILILFYLNESGFGDPFEFL